MFSDAQLNLISGYVSEMRDMGYLYYLAYNQTNTSSADQPDLIIYFSKDEIFGKSLYSYTVPSDSLKYSFRTGNPYSSNYSARVSVERVDSIEIGLAVPVYSHVSTNAKFLTSTEIQPNLAVEVKSNETQGGILFIFCVFIFLYAFIHFFRR